MCIRDRHKTWKETYELVPNIADYFLWVNVRNPWERMVSLYFYQKNEMGDAHTDNFSRFIEDLYFSIVHNIKKFHYDTRSQWEYISDSQGEIAVDYVCYLPNIAEDFQKIKERLNLPSEWNYPHFGSNKHGDYREYYDKLTVHYVNEMYKKEIEFFEFEFDDAKKFKYPITDLREEPFQVDWRKRLSS